MSDAQDDRFASAAERLRRMERTIAPYIPQDGLEISHPRGEWVPGDHLIAECDTVDSKSANSK